MTLLPLLVKAPDVGAAGIGTTISKHHAARIGSSDVGTEKAMEELAALAVSVAERLAVRSRPLRKREFETTKVSRGGDRVSHFMFYGKRLATPWRFSDRFGQLLWTS